jgi:hypothetical protein
MIDLSIITANVTRERVAEQFPSSAATEATDATDAAPVRRAAVRSLRAVADRLEPAPRFTAQTS